MYHRYNNNGSDDDDLSNNDDGDECEDELVISLKKWYYI